MRISAEEIIEALEKAIDQLSILLPSKESNYGNMFRFNLKQAALRISEKADRIWFGTDDEGLPKDKECTDSLEDTLMDIMGWAAVAAAMHKKIGDTK